MWGGSGLSISAAIFFLGFNCTSDMVAFFDICVKIEHELLCSRAICKVVTCGIGLLCIHIGNV